MIVSELTQGREPPATIRSIMSYWAKVQKEPLNYVPREIYVRKRQKKNFKIVEDGLEMEE